MEDQPADSGDLTPRRRFPWRRRGKAAGAETPVADQPSTEPSAEPPEEARAKPRPMGKGARAAAAVEATHTEPEPDAEVEPKADVESDVESETEPAPEPDAEAEAESEPEPDAESESEPDAEAEPQPEAESEPEPEPVLVPHQPAGKRLTYAAAGAAGLFVAAGAFAGAMAQPYLSDRALVDTKLQVAQTSADAITTLWSYTPDNIESLPDRAERYLSNDFAVEYRRFIDSIVPSNKQAQISNETQVVGTAVETITPTEATAIVYTNSVSTSPVTKNVPSLRYLSYRLSLTHVDGQWRITQMPALTQLDLSPQL
ncbi:mammalian cell entry protein [Mycobacterium sp. NPDC003449]